MTKISYEERINLYYDRKNGMSFSSIKSKYGINKSGVEYLVRLIDKHGFNIEEINSKNDLVLNDIHNEEMIDKIIKNERIR